MKKLIVAALLGLSLAATTVTGAPGKPTELTWDDLMPPVGAPYVPLYSYNPVKSLDGKFVKLPGYIVPLESDAGGELSEFLLVPYFGACIHVPPPPPNQIVYVKLKKPFNLKSMADPYWITGTLTTKPWTGDMADTDYVMSGDKVELFEWQD